MLSLKRTMLLLVWSGLTGSQLCSAQVSLPRLVSSGMVLQRDEPLRIWGWANPGQEVTVKFRGEAYRATAGGDRRWVAVLPALHAGGPFDMDIEAINHITLRNVFVGDVWLCSGQSNMDLTMDRVKERYPEVIAHADNPAIRQFTVATRYDFSAPADDLSTGKWEGATSASVLQFSAVAYFFARALYEKYHVPVGLVKASVGGSPAEAWLSESALRQFPDYLATALQFRDKTYMDSIQEHDKAMNADWYNRVWSEDKGGQTTQRWYDAGYDASGWQTMNLPGYWADQGVRLQDGRPQNGVVWFRKEVSVPASMAGMPVKLRLGCIVDRDSVYVNGVFAGTTGYQYPPRIYSLPAGMLRAGKNTIVIRVINSSGKGGFVPDKPYQLEGGGQVIDLKGPWQYKVGMVSDALPPSTTFQYQPMGLFNGMIAPVIPFVIKGVIWYQGEANTGRAAQYRTVLSALINDWRRQCGKPHLPFLYVQLANFMAPKEEPSESNWAALREAQRETLSVPYTGMAVTIDLGEWNDIHPLNKEEVGRRLALAAQRVAYEEKRVIASGPVYKSMKVQGDKILLRFSNTGITDERDLPAVKGGGELKYFAIAGADKKYVWAKARIEGDHIIVWSDAVPKPLFVRYAWADNPEGANLYNKEGLPASPFETDNVPVKN